MRFGKSLGGSNSLGLVKFMVSNKHFSLYIVRHREHYLL